jgi:D-alanyl-D-alanine dipeptidase
VVFVSLLLILTVSGCRPKAGQESGVLKAPVLPSDTVENNEEDVFVFGQAPGGNPDSQEAEKPKTYIDYPAVGGAFELPLAGSTGFAAKRIPIYSEAGEDSAVLGILAAGQAFTVLAEEERWWQVEVSGGTGWVLSVACFINLPDIIPSMVYNITNTYSSLFRSSGFEIPNVTGIALYNARDFNQRLGRDEFIVPVLYAMAPKIWEAQQAALADGNTVIIYEAFRPHDAHQIVFDNFKALIETNEAVKEGVTSGWFTVNWFLAPSPYTHQRGTAIDASLGAIYSKETRTTGDFAYTFVTEYAEFPMQSAMHELSGAAAVFAQPVNSRSETDWHNAVFSKKATEGTILMHRYMTGAGLTPLASEWWHFNDLPNTLVASEMKVLGRFFTEKTYSRPVVVR